MPVLGNPIDGCECRGAGRTDEIAEIGLMTGNDAVEGGQDPGKLHLNAA
jgi:hypothetical protein